MPRNSDSHTNHEKRTPKISLFCLQAVTLNGTIFWQTSTDTKRDFISKGKINTIKAAIKRKHLGSLIFFHLPSNTYSHYYQWMWKKCEQFQMYKIQIQVMLSCAEYSTSHSTRQKQFTGI
jgi:hypothetical protein